MFAELMFTHRNTHGVKNIFLELICINNLNEFEQSWLQLSSTFWFEYSVDFFSSIVRVIW